ncbi:MAG: hypothetical protein CVV49_03025 [Spirochaetae bacterium HGW-Spirochaetae-5]|nr:MAG: hypothetical protein CVV49_03025 [Spirochaetae bacterium HGW-Spirochaetae-5]
MKKHFILYLYIIFLFSASCTLFQSETDSVVDMLPRDSDVPGWIRVDSPAYYKSKDIKNYNREYNGLGIEKLGALLYQSIDDPDIIIKLEVLKFTSVLNAYGFFSIKRGPGIFEAGRINEYYTNSMSIIQTGEYAIYSETGKTDMLLRKDLKTFVNIPLLYIGQDYKNDKLPDNLNMLKGSDGYGVLYIRKSYHKFPYVNKIYFTQWSWDKDMVDVFVSENSSFHDAYEIYSKSTENNYIMISSDNVYTAFKKEPDDKYSFISVSDKWIFGCWSVSDFNEGKKVLDEIRSRIEKSKK